MLGGRQHDCFVERKTLRVVEAGKQHLNSMLPLQRNINMTARS
jgi:hypothetical protein